MKQRGLISRPPIMKIIAVQVVVMVSVSLLFLLKGYTAAYSALAGGCVFILPNAYFAYKTFSHGGASQARNIVKAFYVGEAVKIILTAALFTMVFVGVKPLDVLAMFVAYFLVLVSNWLMPLIINYKPQH